METLAGLGIRRILTSGGKSTALEGIAMIRELVRKSAGRIIIMPGSGINETNAELILKETGATELHLSAGRYVSGSMEFRNNGISMGNIMKIPEYDLLMPDPERIAAMNRIMKA
jgi:copper homeostasis protein